MTENIANQIQRRRQEAGATQEALADAVGVTRQTVIAMEKGNYTPSVLLALKLAVFFNTSVEELFTIQES